jgi:NitT/TauT family transport system ATP-binding protein
MSTRHSLKLVNVSKVYPSGVTALEDVTLTVPRGQLISIVGASGSGKSTLLSLVAGFAQPTAGQVLLDEYPVTGPGPDRGLVFQNGAVYPWRTVERNVSFGLELLPRMDRGDRAARVSWYLEETGLTALRKALPKNLSGGQRQRVALARALVCEPQVLLLDEPFGALDVQTKEDMQVLTRRIWTDTGTTMLIVTHDVEEAVFLGQRVVVLGSDPGRIVADIEVGLGDDRQLVTKRSPEFLALRASIEDIVRSHHQRFTASVSASAHGPLGTGT